VTSPGSIAAAVGSVFSHVGDSTAPGSGAGLGWDGAAWAALAELGYPLVSVPVECGGSGGTLADAVEVLIETGRFGVAAPVLETGLLGGWLLASAGLAVPDGPLAAALAGPTEVSVRRSASGWVLDGRLNSCGWARIADRVVVLVPGSDATVGGQSFVASLSADRLALEPTINLAGEALSTVRLDGVRLAAADAAPVDAGIDPESFRCRGALGRAAMMAGAGLRIREMTLEYASVRTQFGRPLRDFQAVSQSLAVLAEQADCCVLAVRAAAVQFAADPVRAAGLAKITAGLAAEQITARAHQIHGAIGMTMEYPLQRFTRRLQAWCGEYGHESSWSERIGRDTLRAGPDRLWPALSANPCSDDDGAIHRGPETRST
jgi:acyl-CoA dehydrogenase